jgi:hypothetical protein
MIYDSKEEFDKLGKRSEGEEEVKTHRNEIEKREKVMA